MKPEKSPLSQLVLRFSSQTQTKPIEPHDSTQKIWPNEIITKQKEIYITDLERHHKKIKVNFNAISL
jgi:hypothetical protein